MLPQRMPPRFGPLQSRWKAPELQAKSDDLIGKYDQAIGDKVASVQGRDDDQPRRAQ
jgi:hypothetical protein